MADQISGWISSARSKPLPKGKSAPPPSPKKPGVLGRVFQGAVRGIDAITRGARKGVAFALTPIAGKIIDVAQKNDPSLRVQPIQFTSRVKQSTIDAANKRTPIPSFKLESGFEQAKQAARLIGAKGTAGALEESGALKKAASFKGAARNFAIDVLTDPTNALTFGVGKGAKIADTVGKGIRLTERVGTQAYKKAVTETIAEVGKKNVSKMNTAQYLERVIRPAEMKVNNLIRSGAKGIVDKGGIKIAGRTLVPGELSTKPLGNVFKAASDKIGLNKILGPGARDYLIRDNLQAKRQVQLFHDIQNGRNSEFADILAPALKGLGKADRKLATTIRVTGGQSAGKFKPVLDLAENTLGTLGNELERRGLVKGLLDDYLPIVLKDPKQKAALGEFVNRIAPNFKFGKPREVFDTLLEAQKAGFDVETDIGVLLSGYVKSANRAIAKQDLLDNLVKTGVAQPKTMFRAGAEGLEQVPTPQMAVSGEPMIGVSGVSELAEHNLPASVAQHLQNMDQEFVKEASSRGFLKAYDTTLNLFRGWLTSAFPAFHFRNEVSNTIQNALDIGLFRAVDPRLNASAIKLMASKKLDDVLRFGGQEFKVGQLRQLMRDMGVIQGSDPFEVIGNISKYNLGRRTGRFIENRARAINFLANLEKTGNPFSAAESVKKFLFDYSALSPFERNVMRRVFLFPTWNSRNFILQAENIFKRPGFFSKYGIAQKELDKLRSPGDQSLLSDFTRRDINIPLGKDDKGNIKTLIPTDTPFASALRFLNPKEMLSGLAPPIKMAGELATGIDFFRTNREGQFKQIKEIGYGKELSILKYLPDSVKAAIGFKENQKIDPKTGEPTGESNYNANPYVAYFIRNNPISRFTQTASWFTDTTANAKQDLTRLLTGARIDLTNVETQVKNNAKLYAQQLIQPLLDNGTVFESNGRYFVPNNISLSDEEKTLAESVVKTANSKPTITALYLAAIGADPADFSEIVNASGESKKKLTNTQLAAMLAFQAGQPEIAAEILAPRAFKHGRASGRNKSFGSGRARAARVSTKRVNVGRVSSRGAKAGRISTPRRNVKLRFNKPRKVRFITSKRRGTSLAGKLS